jgi:hypothetical protein
MSPIQFQTILIFLHLPKWHKTLERNCHYLMCNNPEKRSSHPFRNITVSTVSQWERHYIIIQWFLGAWLAHKLQHNDNGTLFNVAVHKWLSVLQIRITTEPCHGNTVSALEPNCLCSFTNSQPIHNKNFIVSAGRQDELF